MNPKMEGALAIVAAIFDLFSAMMDARISVAMGVLALAALGIFRLVQKSQK
jgi:hypothetical protein